MADPYGSSGYGSNRYGSSFPPSWSYGSNGEYGCDEGYGDSGYASQGPPEQQPPPGPSPSHDIHGYGDSGYSSQGPNEQSGPPGLLPSHGIHVYSGFEDSGNGGYSFQEPYGQLAPPYPTPLHGIQSEYVHSISSVSVLPETTAEEEITEYFDVIRQISLNNSSNMKDDSKPVKAKRKKKVTRKKEPTANKKSASAYAHFFRDVQARIKEVNKSASFGDISKIVAQEWEALSIDEKAVYKRKAENEKNEQFKDIALSRAMAVAGAKLSNNMSELDNNQTLYSNPLQETSIAQYNGNDHFLGNESVSMISYQQHPFQQQPIS